MPAAPFGRHRPMGPATHALHIALAYAGRVALATLAQCALVLGPPLLLAAVMQPVALRSEQWTRRLVGERAHWVAAGWLSTALHEWRLMENRRQLSTTDILALATMKNAAKCDT